MSMTAEERHLRGGSDQDPSSRASSKGGAAGATRPLRVRWLGRVTHRDAHALQHGLREHGSDDWLLLLEHPHTYTLGVRADPAHVLVEPASVGAELVSTDRGGDVTYHGPGQLVGYPVITVPPRPDGLVDTPAYVAAVEQLVIDALADLGVRGAGRFPGCPGIWFDADGANPRKVAAIGVRITRGRSMHGFALNVDPDMAMFGHIVPCGIVDKGVTSLAAEGYDLTMAEVVDAVAARAGRAWGHREVQRTDVVWRHAPDDLSAFSRGEGPGSPVRSGSDHGPSAEGAPLEVPAPTGPGCGGAGAPTEASVPGASVPGAAVPAAAPSTPAPVAVRLGATRGGEGAGTRAPRGGGHGGTTARRQVRMAEAGVTGGLDIADRKPSWLRAPLKREPSHVRLGSMLRELDLVTVCEEAGCPNLSECWSDGTATFMINGERCTRACGFCLVDTRLPDAPSVDEPARVAEAVERLGLSFAVVTAVARDDLHDGGASGFAETVKAIRARRPGTQVEVLIPDCKGDPDALATIFEVRPDVVNHNLETVARLQRAVRPSAGYARSLAVLARAKAEGLRTKSGLIVGLGETDEEVAEALADLAGVGVDIVTIGQYLRPTSNHLPVARWVPPETFEDHRRAGLELGIGHVESSPLTRSSYHARTAAGLT